MRAVERSDRPRYYRRPAALGRRYGDFNWMVGCWVYANPVLGNAAVMATCVVPGILAVVQSQGVPVFLLFVAVGVANCIFLRVTFSRWLRTRPDLLGD